MVQTIINFILNYISEIISGVIGGIVGSGITIHYTKNNQTQKNGAFSKNNTQIGEINVRK